MGRNNPEGAITEIYQSVCILILALSTAGPEPKPQSSEQDSEPDVPNFSPDWSCFISSFLDRAPLNKEANQSLIDLFFCVS